MLGGKWREERSVGREMEGGAEYLEVVKGLKECLEESGGRRGVGREIENGAEYLEERNVLEGWSEKRNAGKEVEGREECLESSGGWRKVLAGMWREDRSAQRGLEGGKECREGQAERGRM